MNLKGVSMEKYLLIFMSLSLTFSLFTMDHENAEELSEKIRPMFSDKAFQKHFGEVDPLKLQRKKTTYSILLQQIRCNEKYNQFDPQINPKEDVSVDDTDIELIGGRVYNSETNTLYSMSIEQKQAFAYIFKINLEIEVYRKASRELKKIVSQIKEEERIKEEESKKSVLSNLLGNCAVS